MNYGFIIGSIQKSLIYHIIASIAGWFSRQWSGSPIIQWFLRQPSGEARSQSSVFYRLFLTVQRLLYKLFHAVRLDKVTVHSIFRRPVIWSGLAVLLAPVLPTMAVLGLVLVAFCSLILAFGCDPERKLGYFPVNKFVYCFALVYLCAAFTSVTRGASLPVSAMFCAFALFFIALTNSITTYKQLKTVSALLVLMGVAVALYGFYQYFAPNQWHGAWLDSDYFGAGFRVYSTLGNPNVLGEYFLLAIPLCVGFLFSARTWLKRIFWAGCFGIMMLCMVLTYSRGCWLGICLAAAIFMVMYDRRFLLVGVLALAFRPAGFHPAAAHEHRRYDRHLHLLPGVHLAGYRGHAEGLLVLRRGTRTGCVQRSVSRLFPGHNLRPPCPQPAFADHGGYGHLRSGAAGHRGIFRLP